MIQQGTLHETPFFKLLARLHAAASTGVLTLRRGPTEKKIYFDTGDMVHAESNLLHETLGKFLLSKGLLTAEQEQTCLIRSMDGAQSFTESLLSQKLIEPARLSEAVRENLRALILECFAWEQGEFSFEPGTDFLERQTGTRVNFLRAVMDGCASLSAAAFESYAFAKGEKKVQASFPADLDLKRLELTVNEVAIFKLLAKPMLLSELAERTKIPTEDVAKILLGALTLGYAKEVSLNADLSLDELVGMALLSSLKPAQEKATTAAMDPKTKEIADELASLHLRLADLNPFELLGVPLGATFVSIRDAFLSFAKKYNPARFEAGDVRAMLPQAEEVFLRGVRSFATLSDPDQKEKALDRIKAAAAAAASQGGKKRPGESFKIQTQLLDAPSQYEKGLNYLKTKNFAQASEFFQYACDIDPARPEYVAHLAWCKFQMAPERLKTDAQQLFERCMRAKTPSAAAEYLYGKFLAQTGRSKEALAHLKRATALDTKNPEYVRELRKVEAQP